MLLFFGYRLHAKRLNPGSGQPGGLVRAVGCLRAGSWCSALFWFFEVEEEPAPHGRKTRGGCGTEENGVADRGGWRNKVELEVFRSRGLLRT